MMHKLTQFTIGCFILAALASVLLYNTSYKVQGLKETRNALQADMLAEQNTMRVLQAEWAYLADPTRIERLAALHLNMHKIADSKKGVQIMAANTFAKTPTAAPVQVAQAKAAAPVRVAQQAKPATVTPASYNDTPDKVQLLLASFGR
jgi:cell division protein FtsL